MTELTLKKHLERLDPRIRKIYDLADAVLIETPDTLSDEFQLAAQVIACLSDRFVEREDFHRSLGR